MFHSDPSFDARSSLPASADQEPALLRKLASHLSLPQVEREALAKVLAANVRTLQPRTILVDQGIMPSEISVILDGWACRFHRTAQGRRQIVAFYLPGDVCNFDCFLLGRSDQIVASVGSLRVAGIGRSTLDVLEQRCPQASHGLLWDSARAAAIGRRWVVNLGKRGAQERIAHLLCELWLRLDIAGQLDTTGVAFPLSQPDIADACGLTAEHTNRTLRDLRERGLLQLQDHRLRLIDIERLHAIAGFDDGYLAIRAAGASPLNDTERRG